MIIPIGRPDALATVTGNSMADQLYGSVKFYNMRQGVLVVADLWGLPESETNIFAMHIHEGRSCSGAQFEETGSHYNPGGTTNPRHAGDLPPLFSCRGRAFMAVLTDRFSLTEIYNKTLVIHSGPDDFNTQPAGNAGEKIGCGVIMAM